MIMCLEACVCLDACKCVCFCVYVCAGACVCPPKCKHVCVNEEECCVHGVRKMDCQVFFGKKKLTVLFCVFRILEEEQNFDLFSLHHAQAQHMTALTQASVVF